MDVHQFYRNQEGISLIESMVALVVLSIGMLGIGSLILASIQDTRSAVYRTKATSAAWDILERMRANSASADSYLGDWNTTGTNNDCATTSTSAAATCTPGDLAAHDVFEWRQSLASPTSGIPSGQANISVNTSTAPPTYQVQVRWMDGIVNGAESFQTVTLQTML